MPEQQTAFPNDVPEQINPESVNHENQRAAQQLGSFVGREVWQESVDRERGPITVPAPPQTIGGLIEQGNLNLAKRAAAEAAYRGDPSAETLSERLEAKYGKINESDSIKIRMIFEDPEIQELSGQRNLYRAERALLQAWPKAKEKLTSGIHVGIQGGYIPADVEQRLPGALNSTLIRVADEAILIAQADDPELFEGMQAFYESGDPKTGSKDEIRFISSGRKFSATIENEVVHELLHKLSGGTFVTSDDVTGTHSRTRVSFASEQGIDRPSKPFLVEAVNTYLEKACITGDFENFNPDNDEDLPRLYYGTRKVLEQFITQSNGLVTISDFSRASFEDTGAEGTNFADRRKLVQAAQAAYGYGALSKLETLCAAAEKLSSYHDVKHAVLPLIHPPVLDQQGRVIQLGRLEAPSSKEHGEAALPTAA